MIQYTMTHTIPLSISLLSDELISLNFFDLHFSIFSGVCVCHNVEIKEKILVASSFLLPCGNPYPTVLSGGFKWSNMTAAPFPSVPSCQSRTESTYLLS